jgi:hypothetical protein
MQASEFLLTAEYLLALGLYVGLVRVRCCGVGGKGVTTTSLAALLHLRFFKEKYASVSRSAKITPLKALSTLDLFS